MRFSTFKKIALLSLATQAQAWSPVVTTEGANLGGLIQGLSAAFSRLLGQTRKTPVTVGPFEPSADNLIMDTPTILGGIGYLGWTFPAEGIESGQNVFDGFSKNISFLYTPPGGTERLLAGMLIGPAYGLCGFAPGSISKAFFDSSVVGTYTGRWIVEFGQSTQPHAPVDPRTGCGPEPFDLTTVEFVRTWEVVAAA